MLKKNEILSLTGTDYCNMTVRLLEEIEIEKILPEKEALVGIKPNLVAPTEASYGATTHCEIVEGIIKVLKEKGYHNLIMLEGSWVGDRTEEAVQACGYDQLSEKYEVPFFDMQKEKGEETDCGGISIKICKKAKEVDYLINVPVLKGHCQTKITCALKNMKGLIPNTEKRRFHAMGLHKPVAHLNAGLKQSLIVIDNICGDLDFEDGGNPVTMNRILVARDPVLVDSYVSRMLHYEKEEIPYIQLAEQLGVGSSDLEKAEIHSLDGREEREVPISRKVVELADAVEEVESCSACYGYLLPALEELKKEGFFEKLQEKICIGQGYRGKTGKLGIGNCTRKFEHFLEGCPPTEGQIYEFLKKYLEE